MKKIGFGIIGCGAIAKMHAGAINAVDNARLVACSDINQENREKFAKEYNIKAYSDANDMLNDENIDAVSICTPSGLHKKFCIAAANAGKHIVVEKPMALTAQECDEIIAASEKNNVKVEVISQNRYKDTFRYVKKIVEDGVLGRIVNADIYMKFYRSPEYYASSNWKGTWSMDGGGALMNQGIHGVDILLFIMGRVKSVFGHAKTLVHDIEVEDTASAIVEFENGAIGVIQGTTSVFPGYPRLLEINGEKGSVSLIEGDIAIWDVPGVEKPDFKVTEGQPHKDPMAFDIEGHIEQIKDVVKAITTDCETFVNQYEGKRPVELINAIYKSSQTGKKIELL